MGGGQSPAKQQALHPQTGQSSKTCRVGHVRAKTRSAGSPRVGAAGCCIHPSVHYPFTHPSSTHPSIIHPSSIHPSIHHLSSIHHPSIIHPSSIHPPTHSLAHSSGIHSLIYSPTDSFMHPLCSLLSTTSGSDSGSQSQDSRGRVTPTFQQTHVA